MGHYKVGDIVYHRSDLRLIGQKDVITNVRTTEQPSWFHGYSTTSFYYKTEMGGKKEYCDSDLTDSKTIPFFKHVREVPKSIRTSWCTDAQDLSTPNYCNFILYKMSKYILGIPINKRRDRLLQNCLVLNPNAHLLGETKYKTPVPYNPYGIKNTNTACFADLLYMMRDFTNYTNQNLTHILVNLDGNAISRNSASYYKKSDINLYLKNCKSAGLLPNYFEIPTLPRFMNSTVSLDVNLNLNGTSKEHLAFYLNVLRNLVEHPCVVRNMNLLIKDGYDGILSYLLAHYMQHGFYGGHTVVPYNFSDSECFRMGGNHYPKRLAVLKRADQVTKFLRDKRTPMKSLGQQRYKMWRVLVVISQKFCRPTDILNQLTYESYNSKDVK
jgi:hypothetical protein